jgi:hypothetical protein
MARLVVVTMIVIVTGGSVARGQDDDETEQKADPVRRQLTPAEIVQRQRQRVLLANKLNFERWIAAGYGSVGGLRDHLETLLTDRLDDLQVTCGLKAAQRKKLQLAGRGDIKRIMDRIDSTLKKGNGPDSVDVTVAAAAIRDLQDEVQSPLPADSLFAKTLVTTLTPEQIVQHERSLRDKNLAHYREAVIQTVRRLTRLLNLSDGQRDLLAKLIMNETTPPLRFGQSDYAFVMFQTSRIPQAKLRDIFNNSQWNTIKRQLDSWGDSEQALRDEGFEFSARPKIASPVSIGPEADRLRSGK